MRNARFVVVLATLCAVTAAWAQSPGQAGPGPRFEVAAVKLNNTSPAAGAPFLFGVRTEGGRLTASRSSLRTLILEAYGLKSYELEGGPPWMTTDFYDVTAKAERDTASEAELRLMLRSLLAERFALKMHSVSRELPAYVLTLANADGRLGPRLKKTGAECAAAIEESRRTGNPLPFPPPRPTAETVATPYCGATNSMITARGEATIAAGGQPMATLVNHLSSELGSPVIDRTGLTGLFDFAIEHESTRRRLPGGRGGLDPTSTDPGPVPLPAAVQQQLGLKLEKQSGPISVYVVDAAEHPSAN